LKYGQENMEITHTFGPENTGIKGEQKILFNGNKGTLNLLADFPRNASHYHSFDVT